MDKSVTVSLDLVQYLKIACQPKKKRHAQTLQKCNHTRVTIFGGCDSRHAPIESPSNRDDDSN